MNRVWPWRKFVTPEVTVLAAVLVRPPHKAAFVDFILSHLRADPRDDYEYELLGRVAYPLDVMYPFAPWPGRERESVADLLRHYETSCDPF